MKGFKDKSDSKKLIKKETRLSNNQILYQAITIHAKGNISEAKEYYKLCINRGINDAVLFSNYGIILKNEGALKEAEKYQKKAIQLNPSFGNAYYNLANVLELSERKEEAVNFLIKAIKINPHFDKAYYNLGNLLYKFGRLKEAERNTRKAIKINPDMADAYLNLGTIVKDQGSLDYAEIYTRKAIELKPDSAGAFCNLGTIQIEIGKTKEAEISLRKSIDLNPKLATSHQNLSFLLYAKGNIESALKSIEKSYSLDSTSNDTKLILSILKSRIKQEKDLTNDYNEEQKFNEPIILKRKVEPELITELYKLKTIDLNQYQDPSYGNAKGSDYKLFEDNQSITRVLKNDLTSITKDLLKTDVHFRDSFFTILGGGGIVNKHNHIGAIDRFPGLNLGKQKYSLVYYLKVGDQDCKNPGILEFYNPDKGVKPFEGMIIVFPADRYHSVIYDGKKDRVIVGVNFYSL